MVSVVLLGTGNISAHLLNAFLKAKDVELRQVYGRDDSALAGFKSSIDTTNSLDSLLPADIYILAITDSAISTVSAAINQMKGIVAHTSGSVSLNTIQAKRKAVFYPLQTFTKNKSVDFQKIPICIEAESKDDLYKLEILAISISSVVHEISSKQRRKIHLSAVLVNNFTNHLYHWANDICSENNIPFKLLQPLIQETVNKIEYLSPREAQTGPARRDDVETMRHHLEQLKDPLQKKIYQLLSESIKNTYEKEL